MPLSLFNIALHHHIGVLATKAQGQLLLAGHLESRQL